MHPLQYSPFLLATDAKAAKAKESVETADKVSKKITELTKTAR